MKGSNRLDHPKGSVWGAHGGGPWQDVIVRGGGSERVSKGVKERTGRSIKWVPSPHFGERTGRVDAVVLHYTATGTIEEVIDLFGGGGMGTSAHYVIGRRGRVIQMVDLERKAWHAGTSEFQGRPDVNDFSIGIELVNWGLLEERDGAFFVWGGGYETMYPGQSPVYAGGQWWDPFPETQYRALTGLIEQIRAHYRFITPDRIVGHGDVALPKGRKMDPGQAFDWARVKRG